MANAAAFSGSYTANLGPSIEGYLTPAVDEECASFFEAAAEGRLTIQLRDPDERTVTIGPGQLYVVPRGVQHCPVADGDVSAMLIEPAGVVNTGTAGGDLTATYDDSLLD